MLTALECLNGHYQPGRRVSGQSRGVGFRARSEECPRAKERLAARAQQTRVLHIHSIQIPLSERESSPRSPSSRQLSNNAQPSHIPPRRPTALLLLLRHSSRQPPSHQDPHQRPDAQLLFPRQVPLDVLELVSLDLSRANLDSKDLLDRAENLPVFRSLRRRLSRGNGGGGEDWRGDVGGGRGDGVEFRRVERGEGGGERRGGGVVVGFRGL